jgi:hypothetical protein
MEMISITQLSKANYEDIIPPTTPRSLRACKAEGIDPGELRFLPLSVFALHELKEHPVKRDNFDHFVQLRHDAHVSTLITDLQKVKRRFKEQKKEALRKLDISRKNKHRILSNKQRALEAKLGEANANELQKTLTTLGIDPNNPPDWLDVDQDGSISQEELVPLREVMKRMTVEKKRQERVLKIKLSREIDQIQQRKQEEQDRAVLQQTQQKKLQQEIESKRRRELEQHEQKILQRETKLELQREAERTAKQLFQEHHGRRKKEEDMKKKQVLAQNLKLNKQLLQRKENNRIRDDHRKLREDEQIKHTVAKWEANDASRRKDTLLIEQQRKQQQLQAKQKRKDFEEKMLLTKQKEQKRAMQQSKLIEDKALLGKRRVRTAATLRRKKIFVDNIKKNEKAEECNDYLRHKQEAKRLRLKEKLRKKRKRRERHHREVMLELESTKLKNMLKNQSKRLAVERTRKIQDQKYLYVHKQTNTKNSRSDKLKQQKLNVLVQSKHVRRTMATRKKHMDTIIAQLKIDDKWGPAESLLNNIAAGVSIEIKRPSNSKPSKHLKSPRSGKHLASKEESYFGNPHLGNNIADSAYENTWRNIRNGRTAMGKSNSRRHGVSLDAVTSSASPISPHIVRMKRARKWCNLSARKFERIFGNVDDRHNQLTSL